MRPLSQNKMEVTSFIRKLTKKPSPNIGCFLAVQIDTEFIKTAVWEIKNDLPEIIGIGGTAQWDGTSVEVLLEAIDTSLSIALEKIPEKIEIAKAIFGLPEGWVSPESILPARLNDIKTICEKMAFKPLGFVITTEAIAQYLKAKEGTPASAILIRVSTSEVAVSIIRLGIIEATHIAGRSGDIASDVKEGLTRFGDQESLPSRIILYDGTSDKLDELTQQLLVSDWYSAFPFLHIPKIETMDNSFSISAIAISGGGEAAKSLGITIKPIPLQEQESVEKPGPNPVPKQSIVSSSMPQQSKTNFIGRINPIFSKLKNFRIKTIKIPKLNLKFPKIAAKMNKVNLTATVVFLVFLLATVGIVQATKKLSKATLKISVAGQEISDTVKITADLQSNSIDSSANILPAQIVTLTKSKEQTKSTTGKKTTGDKAKGEITIYNLRTDGSKKFDAGTNIATSISGNKILFLLDSSVNVASASAGKDYSITPGNTKVSVTAESFGPEYNLESGTEFQIANYSKSTYVAKNEIAFTGGTKKEIATVSKKDKSELLAGLVEEIKSESQNELTSQNQDKKIFSETIEVKPTKENYSVESGTESESVSLSLDASIKAMAVAETDYQNLLATILSSKVPAGFSTNGQNIESEIKNVQTEEGKVFFDINFSATLTPQTDKKQFLEMIAGKRPSVAIGILKRLPRIRDVEFIFSPKLPSFLQWIPSDQERVNFEIQVQN